MALVAEVSCCRGQRALPAPIRTRSGLEEFEALRLRRRPEKGCSRACEKQRHGRRGTGAAAPIVTLLRTVPPPVSSPQAKTDCCSAQTASCSSRFSDQRAAGIVGARAMRRAGNAGQSAWPVTARWLESRRGCRCRNEPCARQLRHCGSHRIRQWLPCRRTCGRSRRHQGDGVPTR
jgi:hypothetical protein